ncbi:DUF2996 domain-containing protein [Alkalinema pantanalense CENA528]|uniref:DUF2996 domain-containing protein n=1 Tax=Alkalinema pantanalense TaxID=1620705 RepID=UPI003D6E277C
MTDANKQPEATPKAAAADSAAAKPKKEKPPALESKPFADFIQQDYLPALQKGFEKLKIAGVALQFVKQKIPVVGYTDFPECWQVVGQWQANQQLRQFNIYFYDEDIQGQRGFSATATGRDASTLESFRIDEKKVTLDLLVLGTLQRLNGQKWLALN